MKHPLDVLVIGMHHHGPQHDTISARRYLRNHPGFGALGALESLEEARSLMSQGTVNTVLASPWVHFRGDNDLKQFVFEERKVNPQTVFVIYGERMLRDEFIQQDRRTRTLLLY